MDDLIEAQDPMAVSGTPPQPLAARAAALRLARDQRVVVTGASGFIGARVAAFGAAGGAKIVSLGRTDPRIPGLSHRSVDLRDAAGLAVAIAEERPEAVLHLGAAGVRGIQTASELSRVNELGVIALFEALEHAGLDAPVVLAGSGYEYAPQPRPLREDDPVAPTTAYGASKAGATLWARVHARARPVAVLRLFNVYGPGEREPRLIPSIVAAASAGRPVALTSGDQIRDFVHVDDVAECFWRSLRLLAGQPAFRIFNVGSGDARPLRDVVDCVASVLRARGEAPDLRFGSLPDRPSEPRVYAADVAALRDALSWTPPTSLMSGIADTLSSHV